MGRRDWGNQECSRVVEAKRRLRLVDGDLPRDLGDVAVEGPADKVVVTEDERLLELEADGDDISGVPLRELVRLLDLQLVFEQELLVVCVRRPGRGSARAAFWERSRRTGELDDQGHVEDVLQPPCAQSVS